MPSLHEQLAEHLASFGLRSFSSDQDYFRWQRETVSAADLSALNRLAELKRAAVRHDIEFYDLSSRPAILPALYSQRYDYYLAVAPLIDERIGPARTVLDVGCGPGILTTFYARRHPGVSFVGIDRSADSIRAAETAAAAHGLSNVRFHCLDLDRGPCGGDPYDLIIATHALMQAESDPGLPSESWRTFTRAHDTAAQAGFEMRTGIGPRLDRLRAALSPTGRLLLFEKTRLLGRRIAFQRALAARELRPTERPIPIRYLLVEEVTDDGPFYHLTADGQAAGVPWDESPESSPADDVYRVVGAGADAVLARLPERTETLRTSWLDTHWGAVDVEGGLSGRALAYVRLSRRSSEGVAREALFVGRQGGTIEAVAHDLTRIRSLFEDEWPPAGNSTQDDIAALPLYEDHSPAAERFWQGLPFRRTLQSRTFDRPEEGHVQQVHMELGASSGLSYLYWANTSDHRQILLMEPERAALLEQYYEELISGGEAAPT